jgi:steroid delta-isomerase-like uncharacterized protein
MIIDGLRSSDAAITTVLADHKAFNCGDWNGMLAQLTDDVAHDANQGARHLGREAFGAFLGRMQRCYREVLRDIVVMASPDGTRAAAEFVVHSTHLSTDEGLPPASGQSYLLPGGAFFAMREGRIARVTNHYSLQDWLRQIGGEATVGAGGAGPGLGIRV